MKNLYIRTKNFIFKNKITKIIALLLLLAFAFLIFKIISGKIGGKEGETISSNQVVTLKKGSVTNSVTEKGKVVSSNSVEVFAEKPLPVTHVNVKVGDLVKKGDVIAQLDSSSIEQQLKSRRAQKSATDKNLSAQISAAKKRLDEAISGRDSGKNPAIVAAETSLTQAMDQYLAAQKSYDDFKRSLDEAYNQGMVAEKSTRENLAYQEEATDLKYRQLQDDMNKNANKIADNRALAADKSRQEAYLQNALDNEKRRLTELGISIKEEQGRLAEAQEKVTSYQTEITSLGAEKSQLEAKLQKANLELNQPQNTPEKKQEIQKTIDETKKNIANKDAEIQKNKDAIEAINFEEIKKSANENINRLTRTQNEVEIEVNRISEDLASAKADQQKYTSEAEAMEKELEGQQKQVDATRLEVKKAKEDLASDADKAIKSQKARDDELKTLAQNLETARDNYESAKRNLESTKTQVANEISGLSDNLKTARAGANNLDSVEIENLTEELEKSLIKAPADGTVTEVNAKEGQAPAAAVAKIETIDTLRIESQVKEYDKNSVAVGTLVEITSDSAMGETYKGRVISIDPVPMPASADNKTGEVLYKTTIELDEGQETKLAPGMTLRVKYIMSEEKNTFKVPTDAVFERDGKNYILALKDMGKDKYQIQKVEVSLGLSNDAETAIKSKDLKENDKVLATSGGYGEGSLVKVVDADLADEKAGEKDEK
ncbi:efflux RND transporter periplasmic adaptor subunit [Peptoniphilus sp. HMSC062D09]|uniref:efflux RND transporter periplasmic adaptor subunit n=1 Tax=Peptoniphilus sp. HMSC062D09 TaxID=1739305 RepID=UPI0008A16F7C|nr:efflux RND transporter periplasmic adaptor subunit [Peptoniphilus sp. HMSC062D09]OFK84812.1 RND transporter [Peptoniphilus sp. HMSC062D09]